MDLILKYFPNLSTRQKEQFAKLESLYKDWNEKINVISRKDIDLLYERHILHSLGIAKVINFKAGTSILDVGTGGGFPGIPLAIFFPEVKFYLVDSIGKKIRVVNEISSSIGLQNIKAEQCRAEDVKDQFDFVVSRAVTRLAEFYPWVKNKFLKAGNNELANGILYLKGGDMSDELNELNRRNKIFELKDFFDEEFFETKKVVHVPS